MSKAKTMGGLAFDGKPQRLSDEAVEDWASESITGEHDSVCWMCEQDIMSLARELQETRKALRELAALAFDGGLIHSMYRYQSIITKAGYGPKE